MGYYTTENQWFHRQSFCVIIIFHNIGKFSSSSLSITPFPSTIPVTNVSKTDLETLTKEEKKCKRLKGYHVIIKPPQA